MPLTNPPSWSPTGSTPVGPYILGYSPTNRTSAVYTANAQSSAFTGGLVDLLQAAKLTDLNAIRVALENLRAITESVAQQHNAMVTDLKAMGLLS